MAYVIMNRKLTYTQGTRAGTSLQEKKCELRLSTWKSFILHFYKTSDNVCPVKFVIWQMILRISRYATNISSGSE